VIIAVRPAGVAFYFNCGVAYLNGLRRSTTLFFIAWACGARMRGGARRNIMGAQADWISMHNYASFGFFYA